MPLPQTYSFNFGLIRELSSAFCTAAGKHLAAVSRCHSLAEAMFFGTLALFGLICSEHVFSYLLILINTQHRRSQTHRSS